MPKEGFTIEMRAALHALSALELHERVRVVRAVFAGPDDAGELLAHLAELYPATYLAMMPEGE